ncbi:MAG: polyphosphate kinase 2 family protein [Bacteroidia bacterium]|nr:polyphosphate kinase 2 family protein [Bacteroidia bacterium]
MKINISDFLCNGKKPFSIDKAKNKVDDFYKNKSEYESWLDEKTKELDELQNMMYAHNQYGLLVIFQAMDAAGKDSTIKHVLSGVNPLGVDIYSFKKPSDEELSHDFMWRTTVRLPQRGRIGIFNRSYYEEVLVVKVHPNILADYQRIPAEFKSNQEQVWKERYEDINAFEKYLHRNGFKVIKIFLNVSKKEQAARFLERLNEPTKNWKFAEADLKEREHWDTYMKAYEEMINNTGTNDAPWYVVPADDKKNARLIVSAILIEAMKSMDMSFPEINEERRAELMKYKEMLEREI